MKYRITYLLPMFNGESMRTHEDFTAKDDATAKRKFATWRRGRRDRISRELDAYVKPTLERVEALI